jgi:hypothetical protein
MGTLRWEEYDVKDVLKIQKSYGYFFKCYMKSKGFVSDARDFFKEGRKNERIIFDNFSTIGIRYISFFDNDQIEEIFLHRYVLYPKIMETVLTSIYIPNPDWGYGFLEAMITTLDDFLLDDIFNKKGVYNEIVCENNTYRQFMQAQPYNVITNKIVQEEKQRMLQIQFVPKYLSYEKYKNRNNPYKSIRQIKR